MLGYTKATNSVNIKNGGKSKSPFTFLNKLVEKIKCIKKLYNLLFKKSYIKLNMLNDLKITESEYIDILKNRGKTVSPSISYDKLLKKVKYLKKRDLIRLLTIRGIVSNVTSVDSIIDALFKDIPKKKHGDLIKYIYRHHNKQWFKNLKEELYRYL